MNRFSITFAEKMWDQSLDLDAEFLEFAFGTLENSFLVFRVSGILIDRPFVIFDRVFFVLSSGIAANGSKLT
jgi:hypothetical protein